MNRKTNGCFVVIVLWCHRDRWFEIRTRNEHCISWNDSTRSFLNSSFPVAVFNCCCCCCWLTVFPHGDHGRNLQTIHFSERLLYESIMRCCDDKNDKNTNNRRNGTKNSTLRNCTHNREEPRENEGLFTVWNGDICSTRRKDSDEAVCDTTFEIETDRKSFTASEEDLSRISKLFESSEFLLFGANSHRSHNGSIDSSWTQSDEFLLHLSEMCQIDSDLHF